MVEHASVVRITVYVPADGRREELIAEIKRLSETARAAEGNFGAQACSVDDQPAAVAAVSRWRDRSDLEAYLAERGDEITDALGRLLAERPQSRHYTSLSG